jgi:alpha-1,2-mannosyltransferase
LLFSTGRLTRQHLILVAIVCSGVGLYGWGIFVATFSHDGALGPHYNAPGTDWMVFYAAVRTYFDGNLPLIFDGNAFTAHLNARFADWLTGPLPYHPWLYPPHFLLLLLPLGLLSFGVSYFTFIAITLAALCIVIWAFAGSGNAARLQLGSLLLCPAAAITATVGQNAFLTAALLLAGFRVLERSRVLGGSLLGVLTIKPQFWLMTPVALIAGGEWRALLSAGITALALLVATAAVFGLDTWQKWFLTAVIPPRDVYQSWLEWGRMAGQSVYTCARVLGASDGLANAAQAIAALLAGSCVFWVFRCPFPSDVRLIVLLSATLVAAPHVSPYDTVLVAIAATLLFCRAIEHALPFPYVILALAMWVLPPFSEPRSSRVMLLTPILIGVFAVVVIVGARMAARPVANTRQAAAQHR